MTLTLRLLSFLAAFTLALPCSSAPLSDLIAERATYDLKADMPEMGRFEIMVQNNAPAEGLGIKEFWIDHHTGQFIANLITVTGQTQRVSGLAVLMLPVPIAKKRLLPSEIIRFEDIEIVELPWQRVHSFAVLDPKELIGKQVKHVITEGRPVQLQSVIPPIVVARGAEVKIELNHGSLRLFATGKALGDAHLGQEVRVVNLSSNKTITGIARAEGIVEVK